MKIEETANLQEIITPFSKTLKCSKVITGAVVGLGYEISGIITHLIIPQTHAFLPPR